MEPVCTLAQREAKRCLRRCAAPLSDRLGHSDADTIHDVRVACRRTRVALAEFGPQFASEPRRQARDTLRELRKGLGNLRELDVNLALLREFEEGPQARAAHYARQRFESDRELASQGANKLRPGQDVQNLRSLIAALRRGYEPTGTCLLEQAERRLKKRLKRLARQHDRWRKSGQDEDLHRLRVQFKKLRYTLEVYDKLYGKPIRKLLRELESAQDLLGSWNDCRVLRNDLEALKRAADPDVLPGLDSLTGEFKARADKRIEDIRVLTESFFEPERLRVVRQLFCEPALPCCNE